MIIRGYLYTDEDVIEDADDLLDDIEYVLETINFLPHCDCELIDVRVVSTETDEALFEPYGVCIVEAQLVYEQHATV